MLGGRPVLGPRLSAEYEAELGPLDGIGLTDVEMDSVLTLVLVHVEGMARWQVSLQQIRDRSGQPDMDWWTSVEPAQAAVMDPSGFLLSSRSERRPGTTTRAPVTPRMSWSSGCTGSWTPSRS